MTLSEFILWAQSLDQLHEFIIREYDEGIWVVEAGGQRFYFTIQNDLVVLEGPVG